MLEQRVRKSIGGQMKDSSFLMFDHFSQRRCWIPSSIPHLGQETITLITKGAMAHERTLQAQKAILYAGDLQFMTAGRGIVHSGCLCNRRRKSHRQAPALG